MTVDIMYGIENKSEGVDPVIAFLLNTKVEEPIKDENYISEERGLDNLINLICPRNESLKQIYEKQEKTLISEDDPNIHLYSITRWSMTFGQHRKTLINIAQDKYGNIGKNDLTKNQAKEIRDYAIKNLKYNTYDLYSGN